MASGAFVNTGPRPEERLAWNPGGRCDLSGEGFRKPKRIRRRTIRAMAARAVSP